MDSRIIPNLAQEETILSVLPEFEPRLRMINLTA